ncbi:MAG TPA: DoxX family protein [Gemmatimonadales bacterium]|nr:DoxX family protein [Gemmatimonadales bacterium]
MNSLTPYAAFFMRLAVGGVFLIHGLNRIQGGIPNLSLDSLLILLVIVIETVGAVCVLLGMWTRFWATAMAVFMAVTILANKLPHHANFELEALLLAGAVTLMALGDGPLSIAVRFKKSPS